MLLLVPEVVLRDTYATRHIFTARTTQVLEPRAVVASPMDRGRAHVPARWQSALYVFVLGAACLVLVPLTSLWWIVPVLGALVPVALAVLDGPGPKLGRTDDKKSKERELLNALAERGEITPATAAMRTSLTVDEASKMLGDLAGKGHLQLQAKDGIMAYALPDRDRLPAAGVPPDPADAGPVGPLQPRVERYREPGQRG
jgi:hypothetical protein